jgi:hypothetical protein
MKKVKNILSLFLLVLFILPLVSKVIDVFFHHHHHEIEYVNSSINLAEQYDKCLVFQYELAVFEPQVKTPKTEAYFSVISRISVLVISNVYIDCFDTKNQRAPPIS